MRKLKEFKKCMNLKKLKKLKNLEKLKRLKKFKKRIEKYVLPTTLCQDSLNMLFLGSPITRQ